jgi:CheY-like chemotaxis protein
MEETDKKDDKKDKKKVILVDDDSLILNMYSMKFEKEGIEAESFTSGEELLERVRQGGKIDLLILDLVIPGMSGFEILEQVRKGNLAPEAKVIILTNQNEPQDIEKAKTLGVDLYLVKATTIPSEVVSQAIKVMEK